MPTLGTMPQPATAAEEVATPEAGDELAAPPLAQPMPDHAHPAAPAASGASNGAPRGAPDRLMCRLLCVPDERRGRASEDDAQRLFSVAMVLSGLRCLLSYVVLPFVLPVAGLAAGAGPYIGIPVGIVALVFDVKGIRRFWLANHRWRWQMSGIYTLVILLVLGLVAADVVTLAR